VFWTQTGPVIGSYDRSFQQKPRLLTLKRIDLTGATTEIFSVAAHLIGEGRTRNYHDMKLLSI
jgi:hypothetical protein